MRHNRFWAQGWGVPRDREADGNKTQHHGQTDGDIEQGKSQRKGQAGGGMCGRRGRYIIGTEKMNLQGIMCGTYRRGGPEPVEVGGLGWQRRAQRVLGGGAARHLLLLR